MFTRTRSTQRLFRSGCIALSVVVLVVLIGMHPVPWPWSAESGQGAGGTGTDTRLPATPAYCLPTDTTCMAQQIATWAASQIQAAFQPLDDAIIKNPANIVTQTPLLQDTTSPQNQAMLTLNRFFVEVVDLAFACLLIIAAYNAIIGRHLEMPHSSLQETLPRAALVAMAVHFNVFFVGFFIAFENALSLDIAHVTGLAMLTNLITGLFTNPNTSLISFVLLLVLGIMTILLLIQSVVRIALVAVTATFAPLGLGCFLLPQTMRWGRLWLVTFSSSVLVQVLQVGALALGGTFITAMASASLGRLDNQLALLLLAIGVMGLVLKIPGMLQTWALHPMMDTSGSGGGSGKSGGSSGEEGGTSGSGFGGFGGGGGSASADPGGGAGACEGTIVTEESGALLLLF